MRFPQGLKPAIFLPRSGTAETVPFQSQVMEQLLEISSPPHFVQEDIMVAAQSFGTDQSTESWAGTVGGLQDSRRVETRAIGSPTTLK